MKLFLFPLFFALLVTATYAFDCSTFSAVDKTSCDALNSVNEDAIANLVYKNTTQPDYSFIKVYNQQIAVTDAPSGYAKVTQGVIKNAWLALLTIQPSIRFENIIYAPRIVESRSEYAYTIQLPAAYSNSQKRNGAICKITYTLQSKTEDLETLRNGQILGPGRRVQFSLYEDAEIKAQLNLQATTKADNYLWQSYCCGYRCSRTCYRCAYSGATYTTDQVTLTDSQNLTYYNHAPNATFTLTTQYGGSTKGILEKDNQTSIGLIFNQSELTINDYVFSANFTKKPYYLLILEATQQHEEQARNLFTVNDTVIVKDISNCALTKQDFFNQTKTSCVENIQENDFKPFTQQPFTKDLEYLFYLAVLMFVLYLVYRALRKYAGHLIGAIILLGLTIPAARAEDCGLTNLATCIPSKLFEFIIGILNAPLQPLLDFIRSLMETPPGISLFQGVWGVIVTIISLFYGVLFVYVGFQFLTSGHDAAKRELAKEWLKNIVLMILLVQASYFLYELILELAASLSSSILTMVDPSFFQLTADNLINVGLEFLLVLFYVVVLLATVLLLVIRYIIVAAGVLFAPIGVFCFYFPPLRSYGKLILNLLGMAIFMTFLAAIIILASSKLAGESIFQNFKIVVMIACFLIIDLIFILLGNHIITKTALGDAADNIRSAVKYVGGMI